MIERVLQIELDGTQRPSDAVMELTGNALSLLFLGGEEPRGKKAQLLFRIHKSLVCFAKLISLLLKAKLHVLSLGNIDKSYAPPGELSSLIARGWLGNYSDQIALTLVPFPAHDSMKNAPPESSTLSFILVIFSPFPYRFSTHEILFGYDAQVTDQEHDETMEQLLGEHAGWWGRKHEKRLENSRYGRGIMP